VRVVRPDGAFEVAHDAFTYDAPLPNPAIKSITPAQHVLGRDVPVAVEGESFQDGCLVGFDGRDVAATFESSTRVTVLPPPHSAGLVEVRVVNPVGGVAVLPDAFEYVLPPAGPAIVGVRPNKGSMLGGTTVMLHGTGFQKGARIELSGLEVRCVVHDGNTLELTPPPKPQTCFVDVTVVNPDGTSFTLPAGFFYERLAAPVLEGVEPLKGPASGGTEVTLHGQNFVAHAQTRVRFGEQAATIVKTTATAILVRTPAGAPGLVDVTVKLPDDQAVTTKNVFKYEAVPPPELTTVTPKYGSAKGGEHVTLLGKNFIEGTAVIMGGVPCKSVKIVDSKTIECTAPPQSSPGMVDVVVKIPTGASATMKLAFQYTR
jgi:IPT/TIG domain